MVKNDLVFSKILAILYYLSLSPMNKGDPGNVLQDMKGSRPRILSSHISRPPPCCSTSDYVTVTLRKPNCWVCIETHRQMSLKAFAILPDTFRSIKATLFQQLQVILHMHSNFSTLSRLALGLSSSYEQPPKCSGHQMSRNWGGLLKSYVSWQNFSKEEEETSAEPPEACSFGPSTSVCFTCTAQPLSAAPWPTCHQTPLQSHLSSCTTCSRSSTTEATGIVPLTGHLSWRGGLHHHPQLQLTAATVSWLSEPAPSFPSMDGALKMTFTKCASVVLVHYLVCFLKLAEWLVF